MMLELQQVFRPSRYLSPFDQNDPGFTQGWWRVPPSTYRDTNHDWYRFVRGGDEVARVEVNTSRLVLGEDYRGWLRDGYVAEITFFEIRADLRQRGLGTVAARELARRYPGRILAAHPKNSDGFWESLGWQRFENTRACGVAPPLYASSPD